MIKGIIQQLIKDITSQEVIIQKPKSEFGDYAVFIKGDVSKVIQELQKKLPPEIEKVEAKGNYINFFLSKEYLSDYYVSNLYVFFALLSVISKIDYIYI